jgi:hypothetical protein
MSARASSKPPDRPYLCYTEHIGCISKSNHGLCDEASSLTYLEQLSFSASSAALSLGTMTLETMVENDALVLDQLLREWDSAAHSSQRKYYSSDRPIQRKISKK